MMFQRLFKLLPIALLGLFASSCNDGCEETRETYCLTQWKATTDTCHISTLYAWGIGQQSMPATRIDSIFRVYPDTMILDTIIYTPVKVDSIMAFVTSPDMVEFILRPDTTATRIRLQMSVAIGSKVQQIEDTLTIQYEPRPYFLSMDCGCSVFFDLKSVSTTTHFLKGASITNAEITNSEHVNISIKY